MKQVTHLITKIKPKHYDLIYTELTPEKFSGSVTLAAELLENSDKITLHAKDLEITSASVIQNDIDQKLSVTLHKDSDELVLQAENQLQKGEVSVQISFKAHVSEQMHGIYPSDFEVNGKTKHIISTQFESHHAREAFPCIDEPAAKATFGLTLVSGADATVIANTPASSEKVEGRLKTTVFADTPIMSTYLLAFVVGDLKYLERTSANGTLVRTYATPENVEHTKFALDVAVDCIEYFNQYFEIPYPLEKCDFIAIPNFAAGAMENWGCITFRESAMLVDPENTSLSSKQWVALVVAHELAHQWFGNLVTMEWWTDLWLNEGFASWVEYHAIDKLFPEWNMWTQFISDDFIRGQNLDSLANSHPIEVPIPNPDEIRSIFDAISYSKGASVIRMLHGYLGAEDFQKGLAFYLDKHKYANASTKDLWAALEEVSCKPVTKFMNTWTSKTGFPLVRAELNDDKLLLSQQRYMINPKAREEADKTIWPIPLLLQQGDEATLESNKYTLSDNVSTATKLNSGQAGFYITHYATKEHFNALAASFNDSQTFAPQDQIGFVNDAFQIAKAGFGTSIHILDQLPSLLPNNSNAPLWDVVAGHLGSIRRVMDDEEVIDSMKPYVASLVEKQLNRLGWQEQSNDSHFDKLLRPTILGQAAFAEIQSVLDEAKDRFAGMSSPEDQPADIRGVLYGVAARHGDEKEFEKILTFYRNTKSAQEKTKLLGALTNFKQPELVDRALAMITSDEVKLQEVGYWIASSFMNRHGKERAWQWMHDNWSWIHKKFGSDIMTFALCPKYSAAAFSTDEFALEYKSFFENAVIDGIERPVKQGLETIEWQSSWRKAEQGELLKFFKSY